MFHMLNTGAVFSYQYTHMLSGSVVLSLLRNDTCHDQLECYVWTRFAIMRASCMHAQYIVMSSRYLNYSQLYYAYVYRTTDANICCVRNHSFSFLSHEFSLRNYICIWSLWFFYLSNYSFNFLTFSQNKIGQNTINVLCKIDCDARE